MNKFTEKEAIEKGFKYKYYNPYCSRKELVSFTIMACLVVFFSICGLHYLTKLFLILNGMIALSFLIVSILNVLTAVQIKKDASNKNGGKE